MKYLNAKTLKQLSNLKTPYHLPIEVPPHQVRGITLAGKFGQRQKSLIVDSANLIFAKYHIELKSWKPCSKEDFEVEAKYGVRVTSTMKNFCEAQIKDSKQELEGFFKTGWIGYEVVLSELSVSSIDPNQSFGQLSVDSEPIQEFFEEKIEEKQEEFIPEPLKREDFKNFEFEDDLARKNQEIALLKARLDEDTIFFKENIKEKELELERLLEKLNQSHVDLSKQQLEWLHKQDELKRNLEKLEHLKELATQDHNLVQTQLDEAKLQKTKLELLKQNLERDSDQQNIKIANLNQSIDHKDQEIDLLKARLHEDTLVFKDNLKEKELALAKLEDKLNQSHADLSKQQIAWEAERKTEKQNRVEELKRKQFEFEELQKLGMQDRKLVQTKLDEALEHKTKLELLKQKLEKEYDQQNTQIANLNKSINNKDQEIDRLKDRLSADTLVFKDNLKEKELALAKLEDKLHQSHADLSKQQITWEAERKTEKQNRVDELKSKQLELEKMKELADQDRKLVQTKLDEAMLQKTNLELLKQGMELENSQQRTLIGNLNQSISEKDLQLTSQKIEVINLHAKEKTLQGKVKEITDRLQLKSEEVLSLNSKVSDLNKTLNESSQSFNQKLKPLEILDELMKYSLHLQKLHDTRMPMEWDANQCALENKVNPQDKVLNSLKLEISELTNQRDQLIKSLPKNYQELFKFETKVRMHEELFWLEKDLKTFGGKDVEMKAAVDKLTKQLKELE